MRTETAIRLMWGGSREARRASGFRRVARSGPHAVLPEWPTLVRFTAAYGRVL